MKVKSFFLKVMVVLMSILSFYSCQVPLNKALYIGTWESMTPSTKKIIIINNDGSAFYNTSTIENSYYNGYKFDTQEKDYSLNGFVRFNKNAFTIYMLMFIIEKKFPVLQEPQEITNSNSEYKYSLILGDDKYFRK
jgi:hypothetical protein